MFGIFWLRGFLVECKAIKSLTQTNNKQHVIIIWRILICWPIFGGDNTPTSRATTLSFCGRMPITWLVQKFSEAMSQSR